MAEGREHADWCCVGMHNPYGPPMTCCTCGAGRERRCESRSNGFHCGLVEGHEGPHVDGQAPVSWPGREHGCTRPNLSCLRCEPVGHGYIDLGGLDGDYPHCETCRVHWPCPTAAAWRREQVPPNEQHEWQSKAIAAGWTPPWHEGREQT